MKLSYTTHRRPREGGERGSAKCCKKRIGGRERRVRKGDVETRLGRPRGRHEKLTDTGGQEEGKKAIIRERAGFTLTGKVSSGRASEKKKESASLTVCRGKKVGQVELVTQETRSFLHQLKEGLRFLITCYSECSCPGKQRRTSDA